MKPLEIFSLVLFLSGIRTQRFIRSTSRYLFLLVGKPSWMRAYLLILLNFICYCSTSHAQPYNYANHGGIDRSYNIVTLGSMNYYLIDKHEIPYCCGQSLEMVIANSTGLAVNRVPLFTYTSLEKCSISASGDSNLLVIGGTVMKHCDTGPPASEVCKVSPSGAVIWRKKHDAFYHLLYPSSGNTYFLVQHDKIVRWTDTIPVDTVFPGVSGIQDFMVRPDNKILLSYMVAATPRLGLFDPNGNAIKDITTLGLLYSHLSTRNGLNYAVADGQLVAFNDNLQAVHQSNSQFASSWPVKAYAHHQGSVVATCQGPGGQSGYVVFDSLLTVTYSTTAPSQSTTPTGITCDPGGRVTFVTTGLSKANEFSFAGLHNTNLGETLKEGKDVGVVSCSVLSAYLFTNTSTPGIGCADLDVTVKNFGNDTVRTFKVNHYGNAYFHDCLLGISKRFNQTILPGGVVTVNTGTFYFGRMFAGLGSSVYSYQFCVYTSVPDSTNDVNIGNDAVCKLLEIPTGISESVELGFRIMPNPSSDRFTVEAKEPIRTIEILRMDGSLVLRKEINLNKATIEHELQPGCYLLRWFGLRATGVSKIVVLR